jgi:hypothetical protein
MNADTQEKNIYVWEKASGTFHHKPLSTTVPQSRYKYMYMYISCILIQYNWIIYGSMVFKSIVVKWQCVVYV